MGWIAFSWAGEPLHLLGWIAFFWAGQPLEAMDWIACEWMPCCPGSRTSPPEWDCTRLLSEPWRKVARAMWVTGMARASQSTASNMVVAVLCGDKTYGLCMRCTTLTWPCPSSWSTSRTMPRSCVGCRRATWKATGSTWAECTSKCDQDWGFKCFKTIHVKEEVQFLSSKNKCKIQGQQNL